MKRALVNEPGKVAVVTGATSGIGLVLAQNGYTIAMVGSRSEEKAQPAIDKVKQVATGNVRYFQADLSEPREEPIRLIQAILKKFGEINVLVNNAGVQHVARTELFGYDDWERLMNINLNSPFHLTKLVLREMQEKGYGRIVNISSVHGIVASVNKAPYVATKHALNGFTKVVALENASSNITCNAVCPGWVLTPLVQKQVDRVMMEQNKTESEAIAILLEKEPSKRFTTPEEIGEMVLTLISRAGNNMTGSCIIMDGGWTAQ